MGLSDSFTVVVTAEMITAFADLSGDHNSLHVSPKHAVTAGFRDQVAHGLLTSSFYSRLVGMHIPGEFALLQAIEVSFREIAYPGDQLLVSGTIVNLSAAARLIQLEAKVTRGEVTLSKAKIRVGLQPAAFETGGGK